jgi:hypothetical protein
MNDTNGTASTVKVTNTDRAHPVLPGPKAPADPNAGVLLPDELELEPPPLDDPPPPVVGDGAVSTGASVVVGALYV